MGGTKKQKHCGYVRPHAGHVWRDPKSKLDRKHWCSGTASDVHVHIWDAGVVRRDDFPVNGPAECPCGASAWLHNGVKKRSLKEGETRFPHADTYERILALKGKLDRGEEFTEADRAELAAIGQALMEAIKPLVEAIQKMFEQIGEYITAFLDQVDPVLIAELVEMSKANGEKPDHVETVTLMGDEGAIAEYVISHEPLAATQHAATEIVEDAVQPLVAPDPNDPVEVAKKAVAEPFKEPFHLNMADGEMIGQPHLHFDSTDGEIPAPEPGSILSGSGIVQDAMRRAAQDSLLGDTLRRYRN